MTDFEREQEAFREALTAQADAAPAEHIDAPHPVRRAPWLVVGAAAAVVVILAGMWFLPNSAGEPEPGPGPPPVTSTPAPTPGIERLLEEVPGFAWLDEDAVARDDQLAVYSSWLREEYVRRCMDDAGFSYHSEMPYPLDGRDDRWLDVDSLDEELAASVDQKTPAVRNDEYVDTLGRPDLDRYYRALIGESLEAVEYAQIHEGAPPGHDEPFGQGGCKGAADAEVPLVWDLERQFSRELLRLRQQATGQDEVIELHNEFFEEHEAELTAQIEEFLPLYESSRTDEAFARALAVQLAALR